MECEDEKPEAISWRSPATRTVEKHERTTAWLATNRAIPSNTIVRAPRSIEITVKCKHGTHEDARHVTSCDALCKCFVSKHNLLALLKRNHVTEDQCVYINTSLHLASRAHVTTPQASFNNLLTLCAFNWKLQYH